MRVLVFGASSAQGYWDTQGGWVDRLKRHYINMQIQNPSVEQPRIMNLGVSGNSTDEVSKRIVAESEARQNEKGVAFIIQIGSNNAAEQDGKLLTTPEHYQNELKSIVEKAQEFSDKIMLVGFPAVDEKRTNPVSWAELYYKNENIFKFEESARELNAGLNIPFVPVYQAFKAKMDGGIDMNAYDGLHPNDTGHELIFQLVQPELDKLLGV